MYMIEIEYFGVWGQSRSCLQAHLSGGLSPRQGRQREAMGTLGPPADLCPRNMYLCIFCTCTC